MSDVEDREAVDTSDALYRLISANTSGDQLSAAAVRQLAWRITRAGFRRPPGQVRARNGR